MYAYISLCMTNICLRRRCNLRKIYSLVDILLLIFNNRFLLLPYRGMNFQKDNSTYDI